MANRKRLPETALMQYKNIVLNIFDHATVAHLSCTKEAPEIPPNFVLILSTLDAELCACLKSLDETTNNVAPQFRFKLPSGKIIDNVAALEGCVRELMPDLKKEVQKHGLHPPFDRRWCAYMQEKPKNGIHIQRQKRKYNSLDIVRLYKTSTKARHDLLALFVKQWREYVKTYGNLFEQRKETGKGEGEAAPWWKKVRRYFVKHYIRFILAILGFISSIAVPIIVFVIQKKLEN